MTAKQYGPEEHKGLRLLQIFGRLSRGEVIRKQEEMERYHATAKTIQRDIETIREYLTKAYSDTPLRVEYSRQQGGYCLKRETQRWLNKHEIMAISKVLLESRAFPKSEMNALIDKILLQCTPEECSHVNDVIGNERFHYVPLQHNKPLTEILWDLSSAITERRLVEMLYCRIKDTASTQRVVEPLGIMFSEYYFYLVANIHGRPYEFPAVYRLDRIDRYTVLAEQFKLRYVERFEEGEFRKRVQFMRPGRILRIQFKFWGESLEAVLDRLPTSRVIGQDGDCAIVEAEVFGKGIKMWLLSQAEYLEVIYPPDFRHEMKTAIAAMYSNYAD